MKGNYPQRATMKTISYKGICYSAARDNQPSITMEKQRDMYKRLFHTYLNEVVALKDKLQTIQAIINPDQTQESE